MTERAAHTLGMGTRADADGDAGAALAHFESALTLARAESDYETTMSALIRAGQLHTRMRRFALADQMLSSAFDMSIAADDLANLLRVELHIALLCIAQGEQFAARAASERARVLVMQTGDRRAEGDAEFVAGMIARLDGDVTMAEAHFLRAEDIALEQVNLHLQAETALALAAMYRWNGRRRDTLLRMTQAHRQFASLGERHALADASARLAQLEYDMLIVAASWAAEVESKNPMAVGHFERTTELACAFYSRIGGHDSVSSFWFRMGAVLHDVGNDEIPAEVLTATGQLDATAWERIKRHPLASAEMLADVNVPEPALEMVQSHHERWDGSGYPGRLSGAEISLPARVLFIADVYDALTNARSYKQAFSQDDAIEIMRGDAGRAYDPGLFSQFEEMLRSTRAPVSMSQP